MLAYNELAYDVTIQDTGAYKTDAQWNTMLYDLVSILNKHGERTDHSLELTLITMEMSCIPPRHSPTQAIPARLLWS